VNESRNQPPFLNTFRHHYRHRYGEEVGKVVLDPGLVCPHRLQAGGCIFCRPAGFSPAYLRRSDPVPLQLARGKEALRRQGVRRYLVAFQQETPTALAPAQLLDHAADAGADPDCVGLILSTRPDAVPEGLILALAASPWGRDKELAVELGVQSIHEQSLRWLNRGHDFAAVPAALKRLRQLPCCQVGAHLILGIPGEGPAEMAASLTRVCDLGLDYLKLHHLQVMAGTRLAAVHHSAPLPLFTAEDYLTLLAGLLARVPQRVVLHRLWATARPALLLAPRWGQRPAALRRRLTDIMQHRGLAQGSALP